MISLAIGLGVNMLGAPMWSPSLLFAASEQGAWFDPSDFSTMFQDSAGTTRVTAIGQPVGKILDKSGRGNHATQATTANRPTLQQDGSGHYYLSFNGTNSSIATAPMGFTFTQPTVLAVAAMATSTSGSQNFVDVDNGNTPNRQQIGIRTGSFEIFANSTAIFSTADTATHVFDANFNGASSDVTNNGVAGSAINPSTGAPATNGFLTLGGASSASSEFFAGRIYGAAYVSRALSATERKNLDRYLGSKCGVAL